ncbi:MAG: phosphoribosylformylglycinamidine synthase I [Candidatus Gracilibacteria bacterium]
MAKTAVILFPGSNCELEALRACRRVGMESQLIRWNEENVQLDQFDGFILPGGFSYEDRGRSGIIASKDPIFSRILVEANKGKPLIGICNGAQMLVELGVIPGVTTRKLDMALAWNERIKNGEILGTGFYNDWIYITQSVTPGRTAFNNFAKGTTIKIPIAHGEGRYTTQIPELLDAMIAQEQTVFRYSDASGNCINEFPVNPNNAVYNLAGVCNLEGNIMALMPHPERTDVGDPIFDSMRRYIEDKKSFVVKPKITETVWNEKPVAKFDEVADYTFMISLIITDNEERTVEQAFHQVGFNDLKLKKSIYVGVNLEKTPAGIDIEKSLLETIIRSNEIMNANKEMVTVTTKDGRVFKYDNGKGIIPAAAETTQATEGTNLLVLDPDNYAGKSITGSLKKRYPGLGIASIRRGVNWNVKSSKSLEEVVGVHLLHNPHSAEIKAF